MTTNKKPPPPSFPRIARPAIRVDTLGIEVLTYTAIALLLPIVIVALGAQCSHL